MKQNTTLYIVIGVIIGFSVAFFTFIQSPPIQTTEAESVDVYPKFKNLNPQTLFYTLIAQDAEIEISPDSCATKLYVYSSPGIICGHTPSFAESCVP